MTSLESRTSIVWEYAPAPESVDHIRLRERYGLFIDGDFRDPTDARYESTTNPATEEPIAKVAWASEADIARAVTSARAAQPKWAALPGRERGKYLFRIARLIQERARELAIVETLDGASRCVSRATSTFLWRRRTSSTTRGGLTSCATASTRARSHRSESSVRSCRGTSRC